MADSDTNYGMRRGIFDLLVIEARDLKSCTMMSSMDPYCKVTIGGANHQTHTHENGHKNPSWNEQLPALMSGNVDGDVLTIEVFDKDSMSSDDLIASATIDASELANGADNNEMTEQISIALEPKGELRVRSKFNLDAAAADAEARKKEMLNYGTRRGILDINIIEAKDLKSCKMLRSMDPYCKITIGGACIKTKTHENGHKNPSWNEQLPALIIPNVDSDELTIELFDKDSMSSDDLIATTIIGASELANAGEDTEMRITLEPKGELVLTSNFNLDTAAAKSHEAEEAEEPQEQCP